MTVSELNKLLQEHWMTLSEEERMLTGARLYEGEKALLEHLAPSEFSKRDIQEFVFYHMLGTPLPPGAGIRDAC
ncbi:hypothetical protein BH24ACI3_BH24ACI3_06790 [soil metagenome]